MPTAAPISLTWGRNCTVALLLCEGVHPGSVELRLFAALAELAQLAGWMALDAGKHGLAQRYLFTALRAAREVGYHSMAAHVLGDLAFQAVSRGCPADAVPLGEAAARVAATASAGMGASVQTRLAYGTPSPDGSTTSNVPTQRAGPDDQS